MSKFDIFSIEHDSIDLDGIEAIMEFSRYNPKKPDLFLDGLLLSEDLATNSGTLYTQGTEITPERIERLLKLRESNPNLELLFKIKRSAKLIQKFRNDIKKQITELLAHRQDTNVYRDLLSHISENIESFIDDILSDENITLAIYKMRFICESTKTKKSLSFFNHSLNVALISLAIATSKQFEKTVGQDKEKLAEICKVGLFHNYGALISIEKILKTSEDKWYEHYLNANQNGLSSMNNLQFGFDITEPTRLICEYYMGKTDFISSDKWPATIANIILVADFFLRKESGLFGAAQQVKNIVDQLNIKAVEKKLNHAAVQALTLGLNLQDIFNFYQALNELAKLCPYNFSGVPYPLTGFKSPTLFVCKNEVTQCKFIERSLYSVKLIKAIGELEPGKYRRCFLLTLKLTNFYKNHYKTIKENTSHKENILEN